MENTDLQRQMANAIRFLAIDAIENANSGHPGLPMGAADIVTVLFSKFLKFDPQKPNWPNRDRFILSAGHGSMLLYALLYLTGYEDITIDDIKQFRQLGAKTAGHPEYKNLAAIETTTGPLGQGLANAMGMALAERMMNARFGELISHYTYVLVGDGCLMEGISQETISLAGALKLNKLIVLWDDNNISIDGEINISDITDQAKRFEACGWEVLKADGHKQNEIAIAIEAARKSDKPTLIACKTTIGFGSPNKAGTNKVHGSPLGLEEVARTRQALNWAGEPFFIPEEILDNWRLVGLTHAKQQQDWQKQLEALDSESKAELKRILRGDLPSELDEAILAFKQELAKDGPKLATRQASQNALEIINALVPEMIGGSADLTSSNNTKTSQTDSITAQNYAGRYIHYGIREHAMAAIMNGISLYGTFIPYGGTFLCFSDYARPAMRMSSIMGIRVIYVMTHDSIGLGEDGPTHQPVEHLASLRAIPNHYVFRPADAIEVLECWQLALNAKTTPSTLALSRQVLPTVRKDFVEENLCSKGAYEVLSIHEEPMVTIFATGSEVEIAVQAAEKLNEEHIYTNVISVPCFELFEQQDNFYKEAIIGNSPIKVAVEAAIEMGWNKFIGNDGIFIGMKDFGASGSIKQLYEYFGITLENIVCCVKKRLEIIGETDEG